MVLFALFEKPAVFRDRRGLSFFGQCCSCDDPRQRQIEQFDLTQLGHMIHIALFAQRAQGYWEYVQSKRNWAADVSRLGIQDPWRKSHGFSIGLSSLPLVVFQLPFLALILVFEYL